MQLEVFSDVACPFCFIGKRRLTVALEGFSQALVDVRWRAYLLQPGLPAEGVDALPFYRAKFGGERAMQAAFERVAAMGRPQGIAFDFAAMKRAPNTRLAHRALKVCERLGAGSQALEALFRAHFEEGADVGRLDHVVAALERHGVPLDMRQLQEDLASGAGAADVEADLARGAALGVGAVPLFLLHTRGKPLIVEGAQPAERLRQWLERGSASAPERPHGDCVSGAPGV